MRPPPKLSNRGATGEVKGHSFHYSLLVCPSTPPNLSNGERRWGVKDRPQGWGGPFSAWKRRESGGGKFDGEGGLKGTMSLGWGTVNSEALPLVFALSVGIIPLYNLSPLCALFTGRNWFWPCRFTPTVGVAHSRGVGGRTTLCLWWIKRLVTSIPLVVLDLAPLISLDHESQYYNKRSKPA